jgi:hypothetical protein
VRSRARWLVGVFVAALLASVLAALVAEHVFPDGTTDLDEVSYQSQANALAHGRLTLDTATHVPQFLPFLSGVRGDRVVFKYQPLWPALISVSDRVFRSSLPLRMLCTASGILAVAWFAWEITRERLVALLAAFLALASPFTWMQGASLLGYQLSFVLGTAAAAALLRGARVQRVGPWLVAGAIAGLAAFHRPFDALLAVAPVAIYLGVTHRGRLRDAALVLGGAAPFAALFLAYNAAVMGSPFRLPYGVTGSRDTFFFGWRASIDPTVAGHATELHYTLGRALRTLGHDIGLMPRFTALAPLVLVFAVAIVWKLRTDARVWLLAGMLAVVFVAYFFWWATANAEFFRIDRALGPFYDYAALAPLCVLGAWGLATVRVPPRVLVPLGVIAVVWAVFAARAVLVDARAQGRSRTVAVQWTRPASDGPTLVSVVPQFPGDPFVRYANDARLDDHHLAALDVPGRRLDLVAAHPGRAAFFVRGVRPFRDPFGATKTDRVALSIVRGPTVKLRLRARVDGPASTYLRVGDSPPSVRPGTVGEWTIDPAQLPRSGSTTIGVGVTVGGRDEAPPRALTDERFECRFEARASRGDVEVLTPCDGWSHYVFPNGTSVDSNEDLSPVLGATAEP